MICKYLKGFLSIIFLFIMLLSFPSPVLAASTAINITSKCKFTASSNQGAFRYATDNRYDTYWSSAKTTSRTIDFVISSSVKIGGIYFVWSVPPMKWTLNAIENDNKLTSIISGGDNRYLTEYVSIPSKYAATRRFRLVMTPLNASASVDIAELAVYGTGNAPYYAPQWQPFSGRADLLTIATHPDDEALYLSVPMVTYANQGCQCATVFMTYGSNNSRSRRRYEAQESVWTLGNKWYPEMGSFLDLKSSTREQAMKYWPLDSVVGFIVEKIRKYKPSVIVTHDVNGEYWHGAHMLTEYATSLAFQYAGDPSKYPPSAKVYGTWKPGKLYIHLYKTNPLNTMGLTSRLSKYGNKTILQVIRDAYSRHQSQLPGRALPQSGAYDMRKFGLFHTNLGVDKKHTTMFENVSLDAMLTLNPWYNYIVVDRSRLKQALDTAKTKKESDYLLESWLAAQLPALIKIAQVVIDTKTSTQSQINAQVAILESALKKLVRVDALDNIEIIQPPRKVVYQVGEKLDLAGMKISAAFKDGTRQDVPLKDVQVSKFDSSLPIKNQEVTVSYLGKTAVFCVDISNRFLKLNKIEISTPANKLVYAVGEELDLTGLVVTGTYSNGAQRILEIKPNNISGFDSSTPISGQTITITIETLTASYMVDIVEILSETS